MVVHLASLLRRGSGVLGNGQLTEHARCVNIIMLPRSLGRFPFNHKLRNFRTGEKCYGNFFRKFPEKPEIVAFPISQRFN